MKFTQSLEKGVSENKMAKWGFEKGLDQFVSVLFRQIIRNVFHRKSGISKITIGIRINRFGVTG